jgi:hypothetical protein
MFFNIMGKQQLNKFISHWGVVVVVIVWLLDLQVLSITFKVVSSNPAHGEVYSIQLYVIKFVSHLWKFSSGTPVSSINKTDRHDTTEILLKVALNTITLIRTLRANEFLQYCCLINLLLSLIIILYLFHSKNLYKTFCFKLFVNFIDRKYLSKTRE